MVTVPIYARAVQKWGRSPFLNLDAGELVFETEALWSVFDLLSCACGGHAGDVTSMARVAGFCARGRTRLGAHPSYPDRVGFGRRSMAAEIEPMRLAQQISAQCGALAGVANELGVKVVAVKPHGALYHDAARDGAIAEAVVRGATAALGDAITIIGPPSGALAELATARGLAYAREGFADRRMRADGSLVPRTEPRALIENPDEAAARAVRLAASVETICVHADTPNAIEIARAVEAALRGGT
jgi:5-oxoprolinase (ATP-hydrolysing) subunit A